MFAIIGRGSFTRDKLIEMLIEIGIMEPLSIVSEIEKRGRIIIGNMRILVIR